MKDVRDREDDRGDRERGDRERDERREREREPEANGEARKSETPLPLHSTTFSQPPR